MNIDWAHFAALPALAGGILIGLAATLFLFLNGRIAGISGILGGLLAPARGDIGWRLAFLGGLVAAPLVYGLFHALPVAEVDAGTPALLAAGLLVGLGTRYGSGCTSGHGVCGISRGSIRSLVATLTFMVAGFLTVFVQRHLIGG